MARVELHEAAPDFALEDTKGHQVRPSDYRGKKHLLMVFNRGFT